jgi:Cysteine-rich CWC
MPINLRTMAAAFSSNWRGSSMCEACGNPFTCGASLAGCWCSEIKLTDAARAQLKARYRNCLCRDCLQKIREGIDGPANADPHS